MRSRSRPKLLGDDHVARARSGDATGQGLIQEARVEKSDGNAHAISPSQNAISGAVSQSQQADAVALSKVLRHRPAGILISALRELAEGKALAIRNKGGSLAAGSRDAVQIDC